MWFILNYSFQWQAVQKHINIMWINVVSDALVVNFIRLYLDDNIKTVCWSNIISKLVDYASLFHNVSSYIWKECSLKVLQCVHLLTTGFFCLFSPLVLIRPRCEQYLYMTEL